MSLTEMIFSTLGGLRGAVSLILAQMVVTENPNPGDLDTKRVTAQVGRALPFYYKAAAVQLIGPW